MYVVQTTLATFKKALSIPCLIGSMLLISQAVQAQETLVELNDVRSDEILTVGFELTHPMTVTVEAMGLRNYSGNDLSAYSWILDHESRDLVWVQERRYRIKSRSRGAQVETSEEITLDAGKYELYLAARGGWNGSISINWDWDNLGDAIVRFPKGDRGSRRAYDRQLRECYVTISSDDRQASGVKTFDVTGEIPNAVLQINQMGDKEYVKRGFEITRPMTLRLYALVEMPSNHGFGKKNVAGSLVEGDDAGSNRESANPFREGLGGVRDQIHDHLTQLCARALDKREIGFELEIDHSLASDR